jgi:hypothetical protein
MAHIETAPKDDDVTALMQADFWGEHPIYTRSHWQLEVRQGDTQRGYWSWVEARIEADKTT